MSKSGLDLLVICPGESQVIYQGLSKDYAAIEPPVWGALLANFARRKKGLEVVILDQEALGLDSGEIAAQATQMRPRLTAVVVYGQQPSASTQNMTMAEEIVGKIKEVEPLLKTVMIGGHPSALPQRTLLECPTNFVCQGEGPATLEGLLALRDLDDEANLAQVPGLWYRQNGGAVFTHPARMIPPEELATTLPGMAWNLLPMAAYRAHNWHCFTHIDRRKPYASLYTSLGCPFRCTFCCINAPFEKNTIRCWDPQFILGELELLATVYNVYNIKIADEMFVLNERHVLELCDGIVERGLRFNFWAYARVDTVKEKFLERLKAAGFNWLCLGIESGSKHVRDGVEKGRFGQDDIRSIVKKIQEAGIYVLGNYIFGLPDDTYASMQETLDLAVELNCEMANFYSATAYPGSKLYEMALEKGWRLPEQWHDFSQHSVEQVPLPTDHLTPGEVLAWRDRAWQLYFTNPRYLNLVQERFGQEVVKHIRTLATHKLVRQSAAPLKVEPRVVSFAEEVGG